MVSTYQEVWPDTAVHPGEHIQDFFDDDATVSVKEIADASGLDERDVRNVIDGVVSISPEIAEGLAKALQTKASFWLRLQADHERVVQRLEENKRFNMAPYRDFTRPISGVSPIDDLTDNDEVPWRHNKVEQARYLCDWLGIPNLEDYAEHFLGRFRTASSLHLPNPAPLVVWLRRGELAARRQSEDIPDYSESALMDGIASLRSLTTEHPDMFFDAMRETCNAAGVAFVAIPYMLGSGARGVARWLDDSTPMIQLNDQVKAVGSAWFAFYHEVAHILNGDQDYLDLEGPGGNWDADSLTEAERRAIRFAENALVPDVQVAASA